MTDIHFVCPECGEAGEFEAEVAIHFTHKVTTVEMDDTLVDCPECDRSIILTIDGRLPPDIMLAGD